MNNTSIFENDDLNFQVVFNQKKQYSIWPISLKVPRGWSITKIVGNREYCLSYIENLWDCLDPEKTTITRGD
ncbi:MAG: MbtH family NRPS accessory protein [Cardiobacteriaceae bacterium]|nr:MbtH family NRPS accessory protein [Cardiobacteriaceae bacterium]